MSPEGATPTGAATAHQHTRGTTRRRFSPTTATATTPARRWTRKCSSRWSRARAVEEARTVARPRAVTTDPRGTICLNRLGVGQSVPTSSS